MPFGRVEVGDPRLRSADFPSDSELRQTLSQLYLPAAIAADPDGQGIYEVRSFQMKTLGFPGFEPIYVPVQFVASQVPQDGTIALWATAQDGTGRSWFHSLGRGAIMGESMKLSPMGTRFKDFGEGRMDLDLLEKEWLVTDAPRLWRD